jgi:hypothetical protein
MKTNMLRYECDHPDCAVTVTVSEAVQTEPDGWLFVCAWVVGQGGNGVNDPEHFCPNHKVAKLKALGRAH